MDWIIIVCAVLVALLGCMYPFTKHNVDSYLREDRKNLYAQVQQLRQQLLETQQHLSRALEREQRWQQRCQQWEALWLRTTKAEDTRRRHAQQSRASQEQWERWGADAFRFYQQAAGEDFSRYEARANAAHAQRGWWTTLGFSSAQQALQGNQFEKAARRLMQDNHPDRGGNRDRFDQIVKARDEGRRYGA